MIKKWFLIFTLIGLLVLSACTPGPAPAPAQPSVEAPTEQPTATVEVSSFQTVSADEIMNINWQWTGLVETQPASQSLIPNPENYTIAFMSDNSVSIKADCNRVMGSYAVSDSSLTITTGPSTLAFCGEGSSDQQFLTLLGQVESFAMDGEQLVLQLKDNAGHMILNNGGMAEVAPPAPETCAGILMGSFEFDTMELPYSWQPNCVAASAYDASTPPTPVGLPEHVEINFGVQDPKDVQPTDPIIYIIPVQDYQDLWAVNGNQAVSGSIEQLRTMLNSQPEPIPSSGMPVLPYERVTGVNDLSVQGVYLDQPEQIGVRFVGRFSQGPNPVTNEGLYYIYQGGTKDAHYLVAFFYPVTSGKLPDTAGEVPSDEMQQVDSDPSAYLQAKANELNTLAPEDWEPSLTTLDAVIQSLKFEWVQSSANQTDITNTLWEWTSLVETEPASQSVVPNPEDYTLALTSDGQYNFVADCNSGSGSYTMDGQNLSLQPGISTMAECGPDSLYNQYIGLLAQVESYQVDQGQLVLNLKGNAGQMFFNNAGPYVNVPSVPTDGPYAVALEPINVRSGPSTEYPSYGVAPLGASAEVIGVSEQGQWWVVKISTDYAPDGQGWVNTNYVSVYNVSDVPVIPTPPLNGVDIPPSESIGPTATTTEPLNVRSGPGSKYPSYGTVPRGTSGEVIGVSEDGTWWVVKIPTDIAADGMGWVSGRYVVVVNADNVPVIPTPPMP